MNTFRVLQIDHVELFVPDRHVAAEWYRQVLGLEILTEYREWAADRGGPLMLATEAGGTKLALFEGRPQETRPTAGFHRVAFLVSAGGFVQCVQRLREQHVTDHQQRPVTSDAAVDHGKAFSIYFSDPYGHRFEVTTYEHEEVRTALGRKAKGQGQRAKG